MKGSDVAKVGNDRKWISEVRINSLGQGENNSFIIFC
jgi:hypothetical protein